MAAPDVRTAVLDKLCAPRGTFTPSGPPSSGGWQGGFVSGGPIASARHDTVEFLKQRGSTDHVVCAVRLVDEDGHRRFEFVGVRRVDDGWIAQGGAGGGADNPPRDH